MYILRGFKKKLEIVTLKTIANKDLKLVVTPKQYDFSWKSFKLFLGEKLANQQMQTILLLKPSKHFSNIILGCLINILIDIKIKIFGQCRIISIWTSILSINLYCSFHIYNMHIVINKCILLKNYTYNFIQNVILIKLFFKAKYYVDRQIICKPIH